MANPIRVAHIMGKMVGGGVEQVVMNYYRHIDRAKVQFDFIVDSDSTLIPRDEIEALGGRIFTVSPYQHLARYQHELRDLFREENWKIVHSHINALSVFPLKVAKDVGVPVRIAHSHSASGKGEYLKNAAKSLLKVWANKYPTHRFACSRFAGEWLFGEGSSFDLVFNAIDLSDFSFNPTVRSEVRAELGFDESHLLIGHVGRFAAQKNHSFLIEAFSKFCLSNDNAILLLIGLGPDMDSVKKLASELGILDRVIFLGQRCDISRFYNAFDIFVLPSLYEGLGLVAIEAQAAGLPCILSDTVTREVDVTGLCRFVPITNSGIWAKELSSILSAVRSDRTIPLDGPISCYDIYCQADNLLNRYLNLYKGAL